MAASGDRDVEVASRCWRVLSPRWRAQPLSGQGAARHGGRWNRPGVPALYLSETIETAFAEYQQELGVRPGTFVAYEVAGKGVADLTDPAVVASLGVSGADLLASWKQIAWVEGRDPPTWRLFDQLAGNAAGVRVPSAQYPGGVNLVLWRWNDAGAPTVSFHDPGGELR